MVLSTAEKSKLGKEGRDTSGRVRGLDVTPEKLTSGYRLEGGKGGVVQIPGGRTF